MPENATESDVTQHLSHLSDQQRQALALHLQGLSDAAIAEELGCNGLPSGDGEQKMLATSWR